MFHFTLSIISVAFRLTREEGEGNSLSLSPRGKVRPSRNPIFVSGKTGVLNRFWTKIEEI